MKSIEELNVLKEEVEAVRRKLHGLTENELEQVSGGVPIFVVKKPDPISGKLRPMESQLADDLEEHNSKVMN